MKNRILKFIAGFFKNNTSESMTRLIALIVAFSAFVYMVSTWDYIGTVAIFTTSGAIKVGGSKLTETKKLT